MTGTTNRPSSQKTKPATRQPRKDQLHASDTANSPPEAHLTDNGREDNVASADRLGNGARCGPAHKGHKQRVRTETFCFD